MEYTGCARVKLNKTPNGIPRIALDELNEAERNLNQRKQLLHWLRIRLYNIYNMFITSIADNKATFGRMVDRAYCIPTNRSQPQCPSYQKDTVALIRNCLDGGRSWGMFLKYGVSMKMFYVER